MLFEYHDDIKQCPFCGKEMTITILMSKIKQLEEDGGY